MQMMTSKQFVAAMLVAALAFKHKYDADRAAGEEEKALLAVDQEAAAKVDVLAEEQEEQEWFEQFVSHIEREGLSSSLKHANSNHYCIAGLNKNEPAFTLRGQDILASVLTRHWSNLAALNGDCPAEKINHADAIADKMEEYEPQKWPD